MPLGVYCQMPDRFLGFLTHGKCLIQPFDQDVNYSRVEVCTAALPDHRDGFGYGEGGPVAALAEQGVEDIGYGGDSPLKWNRLSGQSMRVPAAVIVLVMGQGDGRGEAEKLALGIGEDLVADGCMVPHRRVLRGCEGARLAEDLA